MLMEQTLDKMNAMKLTGMTEALRQQLGSAPHTKLSFDERFGLLVDAEWLAREQKRLKTRLHAAKLRYPASLEDVDFKHPRGLDRQVVLSLGNCGFVQSRHNLVIIGPTGIGKSYLACAFVERACRRGHKAAYVRLPRLLQQLAVARGDGSYARILDRLQRLELLAIDDWLLAPLRDPERRDLVEVIEDFVRVRHFGLLANGVKVHRLAQARTLLGTPAPPKPSPPQRESWQDSYRRLLGKDPLLCPACHVGRLVVVADIPRSPLPPKTSSPSRSP